MPRLFVQDVKNDFANDVQVTNAGLKCYRMLRKSFNWICSKCVTSFDHGDKTAGKKPVQII